MTAGCQCRPVDDDDDDDAMQCDATDGAVYRMRAAHDEIGDTGRVSTRQFVSCSDAY